MTKDTATGMLAPLANEAGHDPIENQLRQYIRATIEALFEEELAAFIGRCRHGRGGATKKGYRNGHRERQLVGTFGTETVSVPRARIEPGSRTKRARSPNGDPGRCRAING